MSFDPNLDTSETGQPAPDQPEQQYEPEQPPAQPTYTPRTYSDADMARARSSFEAKAQRRQEQAIANAVAAAQAEWNQQLEAWWQQQQGQQQYETQQPQQPQDPNSPWSRFTPDVAEELKAALDQTLAPVQQRQAALAQQADEARVAAKYGSDFLKNRDAVLAYANANQIGTWDAAFRAWKFEDRATIEMQAVSNYLKKKASTSARTPSVEGRGGGAPSSKQQFKSRDEMDEHVIDTLRRANQS